MRRGIVIIAALLVCALAICPPASAMSPTEIAAEAMGSWRFSTMVSECKPDMAKYEPAQGAVVNIGGAAGGTPSGTITFKWNVDPIHCCGSVPLTITMTGSPSSASNPTTIRFRTSPLTSGLDPGSNTPFNPIPSSGSSLEVVVPVNDRANTPIDCDECRTYVLQFNLGNGGGTWTNVQQNVNGMLVDLQIRECCNDKPCT